LAEQLQQAGLVLALVLALLAGWGRMRGRRKEKEVDQLASQTLVQA
jgi:hypothetical protein